MADAYVPGDDKLSPQTIPQNIHQIRKCEKPAWVEAWPAHRIHLTAEIAARFSGRGGYFYSDRKVAFLGGFPFDLMKSSVIGRLFPSDSGRFRANRSRESPKCAAFSRKTAWSAPKNATFFHQSRLRTIFFRYSGNSDVHSMLKLALKKILYCKRKGQVMDRINMHAKT